MQTLQTGQGRAHAILADDAEGAGQPLGHQQLAIRQQRAGPGRMQLVGEHRHLEIGGMVEGCPGLLGELARVGLLLRHAGVDRLALGAAIGWGARQATRIIGGRLRRRRRLSEYGSGRRGKKQRKYLAFHKFPLIF
ncbi:MAG: hypothetical protein NTX21_06140 [Alphaproteobacteria bacterium]|nr:hypothetical protein [Alphaproteobacteria bacterium]